MPEALALVQSLEPTGVGARDLTECLLIQLHANDTDDPLVLDLVENHLESLVQGRLSEVAKATKHDVEEIKDALKTIGKLHHHPGLLVRPVDVPRVNPDVLVDFAEDFDGYTVRPACATTRAWILATIARCGRIARRTRKPASSSRSGSAATALIDAIHRRDRLLEVGKIIVDAARVFDYGPHSSKCCMRDAEQLQCDPSTISRTVDEKYLQSPRGIFPASFTGGTEQADGESVVEAVKAQEGDHRRRGQAKRFATTRFRR
jgi:RNA polymerase sigma-54 factor